MVACKLRTGLACRLAVFIYKYNLFGFTHALSIATATKIGCTNAILSSMQNPNIVVVGHVCIDHNTTENATYTSWGSSVLYMVKYLQNAHAALPLAITNYGPDILPYLPAVEILPAKPNQTQTLLYENDTRSLPRIWKAHNTEYARAPQITPAVIEALQAADIVIIATLLPNYSVQYIKDLLRHVKSDALTMLCPQGYFRHIEADGLVTPRDFTEASQIVPLFGLVVYSEEDYPTALELAKLWKKTAEANIVVTQGPEGANIVEKDAVIHVPTRPLSSEEIVDSVGCGDVFAATLAYAFYQSHDLKAAVQAAHKAARRKLLNTPVVKL